jgi:hypothetical protein
VIGWATKKIVRASNSLEIQDEVGGFCEDLCDIGKNQSDVNVFRGENAGIRWNKSCGGVVNLPVFAWETTNADVFDRRVRRKHGHVSFGFRRSKES